MSTTFKNISLLIIAIAVGLLGEIYIKPVAAPSPLMGIIFAIFLPIFVAIGITLQLRRKLQVLEPEKRKDYLKRNLILLALLAVYLIGFIAWHLFLQ